MIRLFVFCALIQGGHGSFPVKNIPTVQEPGSGAKGLLDPRCYDEPFDSDVGEDDYDCGNDKY